MKKTRLPLSDAPRKASAKPRTALPAPGTASPRPGTRSPLSRAAGLLLLTAALLLPAGCAGTGEASSGVERSVTEDTVRDSGYLMEAIGSTLYCRPNLSPATLYAFDGLTGESTDLNTGDPVSLLAWEGTLYYTTADNALCRLRDGREEILARLDPESPEAGPELGLDAACGYGDSLPEDCGFMLAGELDGLLYLYQNTPRGQLDLYRFSPQRPEEGAELFCRLGDAQASSAAVSGRYFFFLARDGLHRLDLPGCTEVSLLKKSERLCALVSLEEGRTAFLEEGLTVPPEREQSVSREESALCWWDGKEIVNLPVDMGPVSPHLSAWDGVLYWPGLEDEALLLSLDPETGEAGRVEYRRNRDRFPIFNLEAGSEGVFVYCLKDDVDFYSFSTGTWLDG